MRFATVLLVLGLIALGVAQTPPKPTDQPASSAIHPDAVVFLRRHSTGADIVEISMVEAGYPADLLRHQVEDLCTRLNFPARGLNVYSDQMVAGNPKLQFLHATFATAGLTSADGVINLTPLIQAFAGAPAPHTVQGMTVIVDDFTPVPKKTLRNFSNRAVIVRGRVDESPPDVEYQIQLLTQNPSEIDVQMNAPPVEQSVHQPPQNNNKAILVWSLTILMGLATGALVYFLVIRRLSRVNSTPAVRKP